MCSGLGRKSEEIEAEAPQNLKKASFKKEGGGRGVTSSLGGGEGCWGGGRCWGEGRRKAAPSHTHTPPPPPLPAPPFLPRHKHNKRPKCPKLRVSGRSLQGTGCSGRLCRMGTHLAVKVFVPRLKTPRFNGGRGGKK